MTEHQERIAAIRERLAAATPGPWDEQSLADGVRHLERNCEWYGEHAAEGCNVPGRQNGDGGSNDGRFIANAPSDIAFLLAQLDAAQADTRRLDWMNHKNVVTWQWNRLSVKRITAGGAFLAGPENVYGADLREAIDKASAGVSPEATEGTANA